MVEPVDMELAKLAASLKAQYHLPYADCFPAALAQVAPTFRSARAELKLSAY